TLLGSGKVLVAGGASIGGVLSIPNSELFDPAQGRWSDAGCLRPPSFFQTATLLSSGAVLVTGGVGESNRSLTSAKLYGAAGTQVVSAAATRGAAASGCSTVSENAPCSLVALLSLIALGRMTFAGRRAPASRGPPAPGSRARLQQA